MSILDKVVEAAKGSSPVAPQGGEAEGLRAKKENVDAYMRATSGEEPLPKAPAVSDNPDKISPKAKYGSRPGEKRINVDQMVKPLASYKNGTDYVPKTGPAILHEGEKVTPAKENMKNLFSMVPGKGSEKAPKKEIKHIITSKTHDGKFMHKHVHHHSAHEDETHISNDAKERDAHMAAHMDGGADNTAPQMTASPSPMPPAAPAAPGAEPTAVPGM